MRELHKSPEYNLNEKDPLETAKFLVMNGPRDVSSREFDTNTSSFAARLKIKGEPTDIPGHTVGESGVGAKEYKFSGSADPHDAIFTTALTLCVGIGIMYLDENNNCESIGLIHSVSETDIEDASIDWGKISKSSEFENVASSTNNFLIALNKILSQMPDPSRVQIVVNLGPNNRGEVESGISREIPHRILPAINSYYEDHKNREGISEDQIVSFFPCEGSLMIDKNGTFAADYPIEAKDLKKLKVAEAFNSIPNPTVNHFKSAIRLAILQAKEKLTHKRHSIGKNQKLELLEDIEKIIDRLADNASPQQFQRTIQDLQGVDSRLEPKTNLFTQLPDKLTSTHTIQEVLRVAEAKEFSYPLQESEQQTFASISATPER